MRIKAMKSRLWKFVDVGFVPLVLVAILVLLVTGCSAPKKPAEPAEPAEATKPIEPYEIKATGDGMKDPYGIAINSAGQIYVSDAGNHRVLIFDEKGNALGDWSEKGGEPGAFNTMGFGGIAVDASDNVFVVDNGNHRIQKFDAKGNFITAWGTEGTGEGQFVRAIGIATDKDGNVYVTDDGNPYVQKFDKNGAFVMRFGGPWDGGSDGAGNGTFSHATGITVADDGTIYVADYETKLVQRFDQNGSFQLSWQLDIDGATLGTPEGLAIDEKGQVYVTDYDLGKVNVFNRDGVFQYTLDSASGLSRPTALAIHSGLVYIVNQGSDQLLVYPVPQ